MILKEREKGGEVQDTATPTTMTKDRIAEDTENIQSSYPFIFSPTLYQLESSCTLQTK